MEVDRPRKAKRPRKMSISTQVSLKFKVCCSSEHSDLILHGLNEQRQKEVYCDIVLIVENVRFPAHRNILATCSNYFNSMFTIGMRETYQREVELVGSSAFGCSAVLNFLYGNELSLDIITVDDVLETAHLLQIWKLVDLCSDYLERELNEENYLHLQQLASIYSLDVLDSSIDSLVLKNFERLSLTPDFIEKLPVSKLCLYLDSDQVSLKVEHDLLKVALQWLCHCPARAKEAHCVLQNIRFSLISKSDLIYLVKPAVSFLFPQQEKCLSFIDEAICYHDNVSAQPVLQNRRSTLRGDSDRLLFFGGDLAVMVDEYEIDFNAVESTGVFFLDPERGTWKSETRMPSSHDSCCVAVLGNFIFCAGDFEPDDDDEDGQKNSCWVYRYDPRWKLWTKVASLNQDRRSFCLVALKDRLVAVGGTWKNGKVLASVEIYYPQENSWCFVAKLPRPTYAHAGTAYKEYIYMSGGLSNQSNRPKKTLLRYDYHKDIWEEKMSMNEARQRHSMCTLDDLIYAISGSEAIEESFDFEYAIFPGIESYSPVCDQWSKLAPLPMEPCYTAVAVWRGQIYILGGEPWNSLVPLKSVQVYDCEKNIWFTETDLPDFIYKMSACVCVLQPEADDKK